MYQGLSRDRAQDLVIRTTFNQPTLSKREREREREKLNANLTKGARSKGVKRLPTQYNDKERTLSQGGGERERLSRHKVERAGPNERPADHPTGVLVET